MIEMIMVQLSSVPDFIKRGQLFQELCSPAASEKKEFDVNGADTFSDLAPQECCGDVDVDTSATYLSFPAQYCSFDVAAALDAPSPRSVKVAEVVVEPTSEPLTAAAAGVADTALPASVLGAVDVMSTLRYWGVEDELPLELLQFLLESEELSSSSIAMPIAHTNTNTDTGATTDADAGADHSTTHAAAQSASMAWMAGQHREGDMFGFVLDLQRLRGMSAVQRLEYAAGKGYLPLLRAVHMMLGKPQLTLEGLRCATHADGNAINYHLRGFSLSRTAAQGGHLDCLQYAHEHGCPWDTDTCVYAAANGHLDCLRYAHEQGCPWDTETCRYAAQGGHLDCLRYAHEHGCPWNTDTCRYAAEYSHLDCLRYAHEHGCPWNTDTCRYAALNGHLDCLRYAHEHGCPWHSFTCRCAALNGHLDCLQYAHEHGCPWDIDTCRFAALNGHLDCLQFSHKHGCPWNTDTCPYAAANGHLDCLRYAHEHGCPLNIMSCRGVARGDCAAYLEYVASLVLVDANAYP
jgi:hypothetical protein